MLPWLLAKTSCLLRFSRRVSWRSLLWHLGTKVLGLLIMIKWVRGLVDVMTVVVWTKLLICPPWLSCFI